ncbi:MAG: 50S ribosomal protein L24 [Crenarchaeota archaeon]|nr:50S ribosomal protein L24 [Thermoproteota archaeon]
MMQTTKNPRKQRKMHFNAPAHLRHKQMASPLSPELLAQKGVKTLPVRKGDTIRVTRGDRKGFEGKVSRVDLKNYRVYVDGLSREKVDGTTIFIGLHPSKIMIKTLNLDDKVRKAILSRKKPVAKKGKKSEKKATEKTKTTPEVEGGQ